jgi:hypothetical protein
VVMYDYISVIFCRYTNHIYVSFVRVELTVGMSATLPSTMPTPSILAIFSFGEEPIGPICYHGITSTYCIMK